MTRTHRLLAISLALTTTMLAACGEDDDAADASGTTTAPTETVADTDPDANPDAGSGDDDLAAFCDPFIEISMMMNGEPDPAALTANIELVNDNAPADIADEAAVMTDAVAAVLESGGQDFAPLETPEFIEAQAEVDPFVFENCAFDATHEVTGIDFGFDGLPDTVDAGRVAILFTNDGAEAHEIALMRRNEGVTESFEDLLSLPEEEAMEKVTFVGGTFAPTTGSTALLVSELEPGDYIAICFVPTGTSMAGGEVTEGTGAPHFAHGMQQEFSVS